MKAKYVRDVNQDFYVCSTGFKYPDPLDGRNRQMLQHEVERIAIASGIRTFRMIDENRELKIEFASKADQRAFYDAFGRKQNTWSVNNIFIGETSRIYAVRRTMN